MRHNAIPLLSAAQTSCTFRYAHILLHVNVRNDDMVTTSKKIQ